MTQEVFQEKIGGRKEFLDDVTFDRRVTFTGAVTFAGPLQSSYVKTEAGTTGTLAATDAGQLIVVSADAQTITLPATVVGYVFTIRNAVAGNIVTVSPNANDKFMGAGLTAADDKDLINTAATSKAGDYIKIFGDGSLGWYVMEMSGTWARET